MAFSVLTVAVGAGCSGQGGNGGGSSSATSEAGTGSEPPARWSLERDLTLGAPDSLALTSVRDIAVAPDGRAYVLAARLYRVLAFSPNGELIGSVGREGEGPAEFRSPRRVGLVGDTLWVADSGNDRVELFRRGDLTHLGAVGPGAAITGELGNRVPLGLFDGGDPLYMTYRLDPPGPEAARGIDGQYVRLSRGASSAPAIDTLLHHRTRCESLALRFGDGRGSRGSTYLDNHLCDDAVVAGDGRHERLIVVERPFPDGDTTSGYRVRAVGPAGDTLWSTSVPFRPVPMSEELWEGWMEQVDGQITMLIEQLNAFPSKRAARNALREAVPASPEYLPPVPLLNAGPLGRSEAFVARDGRVWIQRWTAVSEIAEGYRTWDVLDSEGRWLARAEAAEPLRLYDATGTHAWGVQVDELDVPRVVRFRIVE